MGILEDVIVRNDLKIANARIKELEQEVHKERELRWDANRNASDTVAKHAALVEACKAYCKLEGVEEYDPECDCELCQIIVALAALEEKP